MNLFLYTVFEFGIGRESEVSKTRKICDIEKDPLTHINMASFLGDTGKQFSPRCDAAERGVPPEPILFA